MRRAFVLAIIIGLIASAAPPAVGASANVSVTNVTVTPQTPHPGEDVTVTATIRNLQGSDSIFDINAVALRTKRGDSFEEFTRIQDLGTLSPGSEIQVPLTTSFRSTGTKQFRVVVYGEDSNGTSITVEYPVVVRVSDRHPAVTFETDQPVAGVESNATVTVSNGLDETVRNVYVTVSGEDVSVENSRRVVPELQSGEDRVLGFAITPNASGIRPLTATISYSTSSGFDRTVEQTEFVRIEPLRDRVELVARSVETEDRRSVSVQVTNLGNVEIENVIVDGNSPDATVGKVAIPAIQPGQTNNVTLPVSDLTQRSTVTVTARYEIGAGESQVETSTTIRSLPKETNPGRVTLTGIDTEPEDGAIRIAGSASNVGLTEVNSVIVRVVPTEGVTPAPPNREYFVGTIPESDFVSFDVYAEVESDVSAITLEVTYLSEGDRLTETVEVPYEPEAPDEETPPGGSGGLLVPAIAGIAIVAVIGVIIFLGWRNYRGGD